MSRERDIFDLWFARQTSAWWRRWRWAAISSGTFFILAVGLQIANAVLTDYANNGPDWIDALFHGDVFWIQTSANGSTGLDVPVTALNLMCAALAARLWLSLADMLSAAPDEFLAVGGVEKFYRSCGRRVRASGYLLFGLVLILLGPVPAIIRKYFSFSALALTLEVPDWYGVALYLIMAVTAVYALVETTWYLALYQRLGWWKAMGIVWVIYFLVLTGPGALLSAVLFRSGDIHVPVVTALSLLSFVYCRHAGRRAPEMNSLTA